MKATIQIVFVLLWSPGVLTPQTPCETADPCEPRELSCDELISGEVCAMAAMECFSFTVSEGGEWLEILLAPDPDEASASFDPCFQVRDKEGVTPPGWEIRNLVRPPDRRGKIGSGMLPGSGSPYRVEVLDCLGTATGRYSIYLQRLASENMCASREPHALAFVTR